MPNRLADYVPCDRASTATLQWLVERSLCRGLGEPETDDNFQPQAIVLDDDGERRFVPLEHDVLRLFEPRISVMARDGRWPKCLRVQSELGDSWQAFLTFGALADTTVLPGPSAELSFAPLEAVDFRVDGPLAQRLIADGVRRWRWWGGTDEWGAAGPTPRTSRRHAKAGGDSLQNPKACGTKGARRVSGSCDGTRSSDGSDRWDALAARGRLRHPDDPRADGRGG